MTPTPTATPTVNAPALDAIKEFVDWAGPSDVADDVLDWGIRLACGADATELAVEARMYADGWARACPGTSDRLMDVVKGIRAVAALAVLEAS